MYHYYLNLKSALLGYKKSQVDSYIKEQLYNNYVTLSELSLRIIKLEGDKKQLEATSLKLKRNLVSYMDENLPANLFTDMYEALDKRKQPQPQRVIVKNTIDDSAITKTIDGVVDVFKQELGVLSDKLDSLTTIMEGIHTIPYNASVLTEAAATIIVDNIEDNIEDALEDSIEDNIENEIKDNEIEESAIVTADNIVLSEAPEDDNSMEQYSFIEDKTNNSLIISEKSKVESVDFNREATNSKKIEHALHKNEKGKLLNFSRINTVINPTVIGDDAKKTQPNSFFGIAVNEFQKADLSNYGINTNELITYTDKATDSLRYNSFFDNTSVTAGSSVVLQEGIILNTDSTISINNRDYGESQLHSDQNKITNNNVTKNFVLNEDARYIRQKYIVGKYAGEDLYDRNGKLIIGRRCQITPQVVDYADREGKLPDLIIKMILRDME